ncbi:MAG: hypothetical protein RLQ12_16925, partial [Cyclobacteriaceae bacterium]
QRMPQRGDLFVRKYQFQSYKPCSGVLFLLFGLVGDSLVACAPQATELSLCGTDHRIDSSLTCTPRVHDSKEAPEGRPVCSKYQFQS